MIRPYLNILIGIKKLIDDLFLRKFNNQFHLKSKINFEANFYFFGNTKLDLIL